jgi:hypothetical protein
MVQNEEFGDKRGVRTNTVSGQITLGELNRLASYNSERSRGIVHTEAWRSEMEKLQSRFDYEMLSQIQLNGRFKGFVRHPMIAAEEALERQNARKGTKHDDAGKGS